MEDYRLTQSGQEVQDILNGAAMQVDLTAETERATGAEQTLQGNIDAEATRAQGAELTLQENIDAEETRAKAAEKQNADDIDAIEEKIPSGASSSNKLATEEYVNDSVATATATFRGTYNVVTDLSLLPSATHSQISASLKTEIATADNNDYAFVQIPTSVETPEEIEKIERYKYNGSVWGFEYVLNNSGFTAAQWAAINSGITSGDVAKLAALPTNDQLTTLLNGKQDTLTFDNVPTQGSSNPVKSGGVYSAIKSEETRAMEAESQVSSAIEAILLLIPSAASTLNQLADKAFVNSSIATDTATFRGTYNLVTDLSLNVNATHSQIAGALGINISTADNNDYAFVQIPTSLETPTEIRVTERYKFNGTSWAFEYDLNNSGFTAAQWAAINSGITIALVGKLNGLPTNAELTTLLNGKQNTLTFDDVPTLGSTNPVKSSGIYNVIKAITDLIPAEATAQNQLADKADVAAKIVAAIPSWKGQYDALTDLQAVTGAKAGDMGCVKTTDSDGHAVLTFYQYRQGAWEVYYTLRHYAQNKPATTGTTGDYPYNGMGRIELQKNIVNGVNTLTQAMLTQQNTIYVIQYDFTLGEDITVPENCVLEFDGGSISGAYTITGTNTKINAQDVAIFKSSIVITGTWICPRIPSVWFSDITSTNRLMQLINLSSDSIDNHIIISPGNYSVDDIWNDESKGCLMPKSNTILEINGTITLEPNPNTHYRIINVYEKNNVTICGSGSIVGDRDTHTGTSVASEWGHCIYIAKSKDTIVRGVSTSYAWGDNIVINEGSKNTIIQNCKSFEGGRDCITVGDCEDTIIENCHLSDSTRTAMFACINAEPDYNTTANNLIIRNCIINNLSTALCEGIQIGGSGHVDNAIISNNIIYAGFCISIATNTENVTIENNDIHFYDCGIKTQSATHNIKIVGNIIAPTNNAIGNKAFAFTKGEFFLSNNRISGKIERYIGGTDDIQNAFINDNFILGEVDIQTDVNAINIVNNSMYSKVTVSGGVKFINNLVATRDKHIIIANYISNCYINLTQTCDVCAGFMTNNTINVASTRNNEYLLKISKDVIIQGNTFISSGNNLYALFIATTSNTKVTLVNNKFELSNSTSLALYSGVLKGHGNYIDRTKISRLMESSVQVIECCSELFVADNAGITQPSLLPDEKGKLFYNTNSPAKLQIFNGLTWDDV